MKWRRLSLSQIALPIIGLALITSVIRIAGGNPLTAFTALVNGSLLSDYSRAETLIRLCPLFFAGLGIAIAFRAGVWNIGAEGQLLIGALAVVALAKPLGALPFPIGIFLCLVVAFAAGGAWAWIAALLRTRRGVQEVISTIMLNFLAEQLVGWSVHGPLKEPTGRFPYSDTIATTLELPRLMPPTRLHAGVLLALVAGIVVWFVLFRTLWGFKIRAVGASVEAAKHAGIKEEPAIWKAMIVSGGLAGLAGAIELLGVTHILFEEFSPGYGYTAIAVALLGGLHPIGIGFSALLFGSLQAGANAMQRDAGISAVLVNIVQGVIILIVALQAAVGSRQRNAAMGRSAEEV